jgi:tetratricopeptide (TPR) repeat protein
MRRRFHPLAAALLTFAAVASAVPASAQPSAGARILVMPFAATVEADAPGGAASSLWLGEAAALLLREELPRRGLTTVTRDEAVMAFDRLQLPLSAVLTRATMIRVGELLGATEIVFGEVHLGARLKVNARLIGLSGVPERGSVDDDAALEEIFALFDRVASKLAASTTRVTPRPPGPAPAHLPLEAFENYVKGLVAATPAAQQRFLESALKDAPQDPRVLLGLWSAYAAQGAHERALAVANAVDRASPLSRRGRFLAALSLVELNRLDGAFQELSALYRERPSPVLSNALGIVQLRRTGAAAAGTPAFYFNRAVTEAPGTPDYLFNLGYANALAKDTPGALNWLREAVRYDAANGDAHLVMSAVLSAAGRTVEAQRELDLARLLGTRLENAALTLSDRVPAQLERLRTDLDVAPTPLDAPVVTPSQREQVETALFHLDRARRLAAQNDDREAMNALRRAIYLAPYEDEPHLLLGRLYQRAGRTSEAIDEFTIAIWCRETAAARLALGHALLDSGDKEGARREADRALVLVPDSTEARALIRRIGGTPDATGAGPIPRKVERVP